MVKYHLEPDFEKIRHSSDQYMRIDIPRVFWDGRKRDMPEPERGLLKPSETFRERRRNRRMYLVGSSSSDTLTDTYLDKYLWYILNVQSTIPGRPEDEMLAYTLSSTNRILQKTIESTEQTRNLCLEKPIGKPQSRGPHQDGGRPAKRGRPGNYGNRAGRTAEPHLTITSIFRETPSPGRSRKSALERLEPPRQRDSGSESASDYDADVMSARKTSRTSRSKVPVNDQEEKEANKSKSDEDDDEVMVLDLWDIPPAGRSPSTTPDTSISDTEEDERSIQALVDKVAAKVRADFIKGKEERKKKKMLEKKMKKKRS